MVQRDVDLVVLEFGMNDPTDLAGFHRQERLGFERLVRKALEFPNRWAGEGCRVRRDGGLLRTALGGWGNRPPA